MEKMATSADVRQWVKADETAKEMLNRVFRERPFLLLPPPLHRLPLRPGNVLEIVGPSPSAKTHILMQAAIDCIMPKEWNGVQYEGKEQLVMFVDLDCRFEIWRFSHLLMHKLTQANCNGKKRHGDCEKELFSACMKRFLYIRCYNSFEFLATLKTMNYQLQKRKETQSVGVHFLMIDGIGAFYWMDRGMSSLPLGGNNSGCRKNFSLQSVSEAVVEEIQRLLLVHPMLVLATKTSSLEKKLMTSEVMRNPGNWSSGNSVNLQDVRSGSQNISYREYMPSVWQSFVTHRILVATSENSGEHQKHPIHSAEWLLPSLKALERFVVTDEGLLVASESGSTNWNAAA